MTFRSLTKSELRKKKKLWLPPYRDSGPPASESNLSHDLNPTLSFPTPSHLTVQDVFCSRGKQFSRISRFGEI